MPRGIKLLALQAKRIKEDIPSLLAIQLHEVGFVWLEDWLWVPFTEYKRNA